ncbi:MAG TPA: class II D-tagatose-bisphosphate aldolase, non-catalytic subunit, partial [Rheinheimera sp.]|nr:class II D-tagatose-bisphosphate aldolase, non-catalytic subunit [Rheinheimera sp.]
KAGAQQGIYSVCSAQPLVLKAALRRARADKSLLLVEATANQVNQYGGYTGMQPADFIRYVSALAGSEGVAAQQLIFGGDHLGPVVWCKQNSAAAMVQAEQLIAAYVQAGFCKIHLDTSMRCADDPAQLSDELIAARAARLCQVAEQHRAPGQQLCYVIGTEVPAPGGVTALEHDLALTPVAAVEQTLQTHRHAFLAAGLSDDVWQKVLAVVVQPGVEFDNSKVQLFNRDAAAALSGYISQQPQLVFEAHSTDYQLPEAYAGLVNGHFAILKVGPQLTFALREALLALAHIESLLLPAAECSGLAQQCTALMQQQPNYWQSFYTDSTEQRWQLLYSFSDRIRYYWPQTALQQAVSRLLSNLSRPLPLPLLSQYLPLQYQAVLRGKLDNNGEALLLDKIDRVLADYATACGMSTKQGADADVSQ